MDLSNPLIDDFLKESKKNAAVDRRRAEIWEVMLKTAAFQEYLAVLNVIIESLGAQLLTAAKSVDDCIVAEGTKGTMRGLILARDLPSISIAQHKASVPATEDEEDEDGQ